MPRYIIETKQYSGQWMAARRKAQPRSKVEALGIMNAEHRAYDCPKRVYDSAVGEVVAEVGVTPEWEARAEAMRKAYAAGAQRVTETAGG